MTGLVDHEEVFERVASLLSTLILLRLLWVLRTLDGAFRPIMKNREAGAEASLGGVANMAVKSSAVRDGSNSWPATA